MYTALLQWLVTRDKTTENDNDNTAPPSRVPAAAASKVSEEFQAEYYGATLEMASKVPGLSGLSPWILKDFQSPRRMHGRFQEYWNRKGIISPQDHKKAAFFVLGHWYSEFASGGGISE